MTLDEIQNSSADDQRVKRLRANAKAMKDKARQLKAQADASAAQSEMRNSRKSQAQLQRSTIGSTIKPYS